MPQHAPKWNVNVFLYTKCPITQLTPLVTFIRTTQIIPTQTFHYFEHWKKGIIINTFSLLIGTSIIWKSQIDPLFYRTFVIKINRPGPLPFIFQHKPFRLPFIIDFPHHYSNIPIQFKDKFKKKRKKNTNPFSVFSSWNTKLHRKLTINLVFKYIYTYTRIHTRKRFFIMFYRTRSWHNMWLQVWEQRDAGKSRGVEPVAIGVMEAMLRYHNSGKPINSRPELCDETSWKHRLRGVFKHHFRSGSRYLLL